VLYQHKINFSKLLKNKDKQIKNGINVLFNKIIEKFYLI
jgi:hypothetical protein